MKKTILFLATLLVIFVNHNYSQTTLILQPDSDDGKDARVDAWRPNYNYGSREDIMIKAWTIDDDLVITRSFLEFDLSSIPANSKINSAVLTLYHWPDKNHSILSGTNACYINRVIEPWEENSIKWNNQPATTTQNELMLPQTVSPTQGVLEVYVTQLIQDIVDYPTSSYGLMFNLQFEEPYRGIFIASSDYEDAARHPKLLVQYTEDNTNIEENQNSKGLISIYPNPTKNELTIYYKQLKDAKIQLFNMNGQLIKETSANSEQYNFDLSGLEKGTYLLKIMGEYLTKTEKVIVN